MAAGPLQTGVCRRRAVAPEKTPEVEVGSRCPQARLRCHRSVLVIKYDFKASPVKQFTCFKRVSSLVLTRRRFQLVTRWFIACPRSPANIALAMVAVAAAYISPVAYCLSPAVR